MYDVHIGRQSLPLPIPCIMKGKKREIKLPVDQTNSLQRFRAHRVSSLWELCPTFQWTDDMPAPYNEIEHWSATTVKMCSVTPTTHPRGSPLHLTHKKCKPNFQRSEITVPNRKIV